MQKLTILITAGATIEAIDPVRYISNYSSGKQGIALVEACLSRGAKVILVLAGNKEVKEHNNLSLFRVNTAQEMLDAVNTNLKYSNVFIAVAAVSDWRPEYNSKHKLKKYPDQEHLILKLVRNPDILYEVGHSVKRPRLVIGFAAESQNLLDNAKTKLKEKNCDLIVANLISKENPAFNQEYNTVSIINRQGDVKSYNKISKKMIANYLIDHIISTMNLTEQSVNLQ